MGMNFGGTLVNPVWPGGRRNPLVPGGEGQSQK